MEDTNHKDAWQRGTLYWLSGGNHSLFKSDHQEKLSKFSKIAKSTFILEKIYNKEFSFLASQCKLRITFGTDRSIFKDVCPGKLE